MKNEYFSPVPRGRKLSFSSVGSLILSGIHFSRRKETLGRIYLHTGKTHIHQDSIIVCKLYPSTSFF